MPSTPRQAAALSDERALERLREIIALADELAADFRRVRDELRGLNRELRERIVESDGSRGEVLEQVFAGVDLISDSESGRTFRALQAQIQTLLETREQVSVAEVLRAYPAEQGLGSVVGYLALGVRDGIATADRDRVSWRGLGTVERSASIPRVYFVRAAEEAEGSRTAEASRLGVRNGPHGVNSDDLRKCQFSFQIEARGLLDAKWRMRFTYPPYGECLHSLIASEREAPRFRVPALTTASRQARWGDNMSLLWGCVRVKLAEPTACSGGCRPLRSSAR